MSSLDQLTGRVLRGGLTWLGRRRLAQVNGSLSLPALTASIEILRDRWGVPHIYAANEHDAFFAQGFVHAQDRLWQMEVNRRLATGRLSEMLGGLALDTDRTARTFGFDRLGRADWELLPDEDRQLLQAYVAGVNAFLSSSAGKRGRPIEFTLLRHRPEPWQIEDTLAFSRVMDWQMSLAWYGEIVRAQLIAAVGPEQAAELEITDAPGNPCVLPDGIEINALAGGMLPGAEDPFLKRRMGSNSWAVSGARSATGHPILCNDMHLPLTVPNIWYEVHLEAGDLRVTGVSVPGLPGVIVGHNAHIAWGITLAFTDCEDLFVEKFDPGNPRYYQFGGERLEAEVIPEAIRVKGRAEPHVEQVTITRHGPVISDVIGEPAQRLAVNSMALHSGPAFHGWFALDRARNWDEFVEALRCIETPPLNFAYADVDGNIGYWVTGKVPIRAKGQGMVPAPGWTGEYEWIGEVPFEEMPHALNPAAGYLVHCNNRIIPDDYPHFLGSAWMNGYRARRLSEMIESSAQVTAADCREMQMDVTCLPGLAFVRLLKEAFPETSGAREAGDLGLALDLLAAWDGRLSTDSTGGALYEVARAALVRAVFEPALGPELAARWLGRGLPPHPEGHPRVLRTRYRDAAAPARRSRFVVGDAGRRPRGAARALPGRGRGVAAVGARPGPGRLAVGAPAPHRLPACAGRAETPRSGVQPRAAAHRRRHRHTVTDRKHARPVVRERRVDAVDAPYHRPGRPRRRAGGLPDRPVGTARQPALRRPGRAVEPGRVPPDAVDARPGGSARGGEADAGAAAGLKRIRGKQDDHIH